MFWIDLMRWLHVIGATVLLGTGAGIAFFMLMAHRTRNPEIIAHTATIVVVADWLFTASAVIAQPITGYLLARLLGWPLTQGWLLLSFTLYILVGLCWLPVVWIQHRIKFLARQAIRDASPLGDDYQVLFRRWCALGVPAFVGVLVILWLMLTRPALALL